MITIIMMMKSNGIIVVLIISAIALALYFYSKVLGQVAEINPFSGFFGDGKEDAPTDGGQTDYNQIDGDDDNDSTTVPGVPTSFIQSLTSRLYDSINSWNIWTSTKPRQEVFYEMVHEVTTPVFKAVCNDYKQRKKQSLREGVNSLWAGVPYPPDKGNYYSDLKTDLISRMDKLDIP